MNVSKSLTRGVYMDVSWIGWRPWLVAATDFAVTLAVLSAYLRG